MALASVITFLVSGLWHGAAWTYVAWGALHGIALTYEILTKKFRKKIFKKIPASVGNAIGLLATFSYVCFTYIFFRANSLKDAMFIVRQIGHVPRELLNVLKTHKVAFLNIPSIQNSLLPCVGVIIMLEIIHLTQIKFSMENTFGKRPAIFRWSVYYAAIFALLFAGVYTRHAFIYFQF